MFVDRRKESQNFDRPRNLLNATKRSKNIDFVLITHEHADHFHIDSLKALLKNNPQAKVITNKSVGALLKKDSIAFSVVENGQNSDANGILIESFGENHALMHTDLKGYFQYVFQ